MACVKHFALYGASEAGRDYNTVDMSRQRMFNEYMLPYQAAVDAGVGSVMASFNEVDGIPATASKWLMTDVLRNQWGFQGFVVTDYTGIYEMIDHGIGDLQTVAARAVNAGVDMDYISESMGHASSDHAITQIYIEHYPLDIQMQNNSKLLNLGETSERDALLAKLANMSTEELAKLFA